MCVFPSTLTKRDALYALYALYGNHSCLNCLVCPMSRFNFRKFIWYPKYIQFPGNRYNASYAFLTENIKNSIFVMNDGSVVIEGWCSPPGSKKHFRGQKKCFIKLDQRVTRVKEHESDASFLKFFGGSLFSTKDHFFTK